MRKLQKEFEREFETKQFAMLLTWVFFKPNYINCPCKHKTHLN